jgi:hypothetical protein
VHGKEHAGDLLELVEGPDRIAPVDVGEGIVAGGAPLGIQRVKEGDLLTALGPEAGGGDVVLALDVEHHGRARPAQEVGDHHPDALAAPGRGMEKDVLAPPETQEPAVPAPEEDAARIPKPLGPDLRLRGPAGRAVEGWAEAEGKADPEGQGEETRPQGAQEKPSPDQRVAGVASEPEGGPEGVGSGAELMQADQGDQTGEEDQDGDARQPRDHEQEGPTLRAGVSPGDHTRPR